MSEYADDGVFGIYLGAYIGNMNTHTYIIKCCVLSEPVAKYAIHYQGNNNAT